MKNVKNKCAKTLRVLAIIALVAVFGFSMVACDDDYGGGGGGGGTSTGYLSAPTGLRASSSGTTINLSWNSVSGASGYKVYMSTSASSGFKMIDDEVYKPSESYGGGTPGATYYFKVTAYNSSGKESGYSNVASVTLGGGSTPTPTPTPNTSLDGYWEMTGSSGTNTASGGTPGTQAPQVYVSGNTGYLYRSSNSPLWQDDAKKGGVTVGGVFWKDLRSTGNLTWSGSCYSILVKNSSPNVSYYHGYFACSITMSSNGQTITVKYTWSYEGTSGTTTQTWKRL